MKQFTEECNQEAGHELEVYLQQVGLQLVAEGQAVGIVLQVQDELEG